MKINDIHRLLLICLVMLASHTRAQLDTGMVLLHTSASEEAGYEGSGNLVIRHLSTGDSIVLQDGGVRAAVFSPNGQKVAYWDGSGIHTVNVDGTERQLVTSDGSAEMAWCTNGYIYFHESGSTAIPRVPEDGGAVEIVHTASGNLTAYDGSIIHPEYNDLDISLDGSRGVATVLRSDIPGREYGAYCQRAIDFSTGEEYSFLGPCQGSISPDGSMITASGLMHSILRAVPWRQPVVEYGLDGAWGNTYDGCEEYGSPYALGADSMFHCPAYVDVFLLGYEVAILYNLDPHPSTWNVNWQDVVQVGQPHWASTDQDVFLFYAHANTSDAADGSYLYQISTREYTRMGDLPTYALDYFPAELTGDALAFACSPSSIGFDYEPGGTVPAARNVSLTSVDAMSGAPSLSGAPNWLQVTATAVNATEYTLVNTLVADSMPGEGTYNATVTVTPSGSATTLTYAVSLSVAVPVPSIVIHEPTSSASLVVGDTLRVRYSTDETVSGTIVSLSTDAGETLKQLHTGESWGAGDNVLLEYVIQADDLGPGVTVATECLVQVSRYPDGLNTFSGLFTISSANSSAAARSRAAARAGALKASISRTVTGTSLRIESPSRGTLRLFDMYGRVVVSCAAEPGIQHVSVPVLRAGRYLLVLQGNGGTREGVLSSVLP